MKNVKIVKNVKIIVGRHGRYDKLEHRHGRHGRYSQRVAKDALDAIWTLLTLRTRWAAMDRVASHSVHNVHGRSSQGVRIHGRGVPSAPCAYSVHSRDRSVYSHGSSCNNWIKRLDAISLPVMLLQMFCTLFITSAPIKLFIEAWSLTRDTLCHGLRSGCPCPKPPEDSQRSLRGLAKEPRHQSRRTTLLSQRDETVWPSRHPPVLDAARRCSPSGTKQQRRAELARCDRQRKETA